MLKKDEFYLLKQEISNSNISKTSKEIFKKVEYMVLKTIATREKFSEDRRASSYRAEMNRLNYKIWYAKKKNKQSRLVELQKQHDLLKEQHKQGLI